MMKHWIFFSLFFALSLQGLQSSKSYDYSLKRMYSTMVRFLVVEEKAEIISKDIEGAYIKFENKEREFSGVLEIIEVSDKKTELKLNFEGAHHKMLLFWKRLNKKIKKEDIIFKKKE